MKNNEFGSSSPQSETTTKDILLDAAVAVYSRRVYVLLSAVFFTIILGLALHYKIGFSDVESVISVPQVDFKSPFYSNELIERKIRGSIIPAIGQKLNYVYKVNLQYVDRSAKYLEISTKIPPFHQDEVEKIKVFQKELLAEVIAYLKTQTDEANKIYEKVICEGGKEVKSDKYMYISSPQIVYEAIIEHNSFLSGKIILMYVAVFIFCLLASVAFVFIIDFFGKAKNKYENESKKLV